MFGQEIKWDKDLVLQFIRGCREDEGYPMFRTFGEDVPVVQAVCWGGRNEFTNSVVFTDVPKDIVAFLRSGGHDWERLLEMWGETKLLEELSEEGVYLPHARRLPKIVVK